MDKTTYEEIEEGIQKQKEENKNRNKNGIWYNGNPIIGNFNLYGAELEDNIDFEDFKKAILKNFRDKYESVIKEILEKHGLELIDMFYYSPTSYNYEGDSIDIKIKITDKQKLKDYVLNHKEEIQKLLNINHGYDGYISLTKSTITEILDEIETEDAVDISVITLMFSDFRSNICTFEDRYNIFEDSINADYVYSFN